MLSSSRWLPSTTGRQVVIAVELALIGLVLIWAALAGPSSSDAAWPVRRMSIGAPAERGQGHPSTTGRADGSTQVRDQITGLVLPESHPVSVSIPRIGVRSKLVDLGLDADGAMEVPRDPALAGWFSRAPHRVHSGRQSSPGTSLGTALAVFSPPRHHAARRSSRASPERTGKLPSSLSPG